MDVVAGLDRLDPSSEPLFVVVGVFDGLHRGHAYLLRHLVTEARTRTARPVVITFDHHPDEIVKGSAPPLLCDPDERLDRLEHAGVATTVVQHFDERLRQTTYDAFVRMITARAPLAGFLMTPDAAFGYRRAGTPEALAELGRAGGFEVVVVPPFELDGRPVRSTEVRSEITAGNLETAAHLLGRAHAVVGTPDGRAGEGTRLRFALPVALPPDGSYEADIEPARLVGGTHPSPRHRRATVDDGRVVVHGPALDRPTRVAFRSRR